MNLFVHGVLRHFLMNEAPADGAPAGGAPAAEAPPAAAPAAAPAAETTLLTPPAEQQPADPKPEGEQQPKPGEEAKPEGEDKPQGAPEAYTDFTLPEGMEMDAPTLDAFKGLAKELNISQESAQKLVDLQAQLATKQAQDMQSAALAQSQQWAAQVKADPELGGENYDKSVESAVKVIQAFGDDGLRDLLNDSGLGNHPALFKFCHRIGKAISDDKFVMPGSQTNTPKEMTIVDAFQ